MNDEQSPQPPDYLARFGLQREPFAAAPDPAFFCADSALTQRLDMLQNLTEFGMLLLLVIGEPGVGKTSVLQQFLQRANSNWQVCHLEADTLGNAHDLVEDLAVGFHVPGADLAQLRTQLDEIQAQGQLAVLVVDDAERLPDTALRTLLELSGAAGETDKRLRLVLFGTEQLQEKIAALSPVHADNTHVFSIPPLSELQTAAYLQHRLKLAGLHEEMVFTAGQVKNIVKASQGVPARINAKARQLLIDKHSVSGSSHVGMRTAAAAVASPARRWALFAAAGAGALLIAVALWPRSAKHDTGPSSSPAESAAPVPEKTVELALPNIAPATGPTAAGTSAAQTPAATATPLPVPTLGPEVEHPVPTSASGKIAVSSVPAPETAAPPAPAGNVAHPATPAITTVTLPVAPAPAPAPATKEAPRPAQALVSEGVNPAAKPAPAATVKAKVVTHAEPKTPPIAKPTHLSKPAVATNGAPTVKGVTSSHDNAWFKTQRPGDYTLQILGGQREAAIRQFAAANRLEGPSTILHTTREGKPWYVLLYGAYPSRAAASQALAQMPAAVRAAKPWPRSIAAVHADIAKKP